MPRCLPPQVRAYDACGNETLDELLVAAQLRYVAEVKVSSDPNVNSALALSGSGGGGGGGGEICTVCRRLSGYQTLLTKLIILPPTGVRTSMLA